MSAAEVVKGNFNDYVSNILKLHEKVVVIYVDENNLTQTCSSTCPTESYIMMTESLPEMKQASKEHEKDMKSKCHGIN